MTTFSARAALRIPELSDGPPNINTAVGNAVNDIDKVVIPVYSTFAARNSANPSPTPGQFCYVTTTDEQGRVLMGYNGSEWVNYFRSEQYVLKWASSSRANTTTPTDDPYLVLPMQTNADYEFEIVGYLSADTSSDCRVHMAYPSGCTIWWGLFGAPGTTWTASSGDGPVGGASMKLGDQSTFSGPVAMGGTSTSIPLTFIAKGICKTGVNAGNLRFQWAQNNSNGLGVEIRAGSYMKLKRLY